LNLCVVAIAAFVGIARSCNEEVCASLVSKCMLLKSCECDMTNKDNCTCCKDCHKCLAKLYTECCDCVGMCPEKNPKQNLYKTSTVEVLPDPIPGLFSVLTEEPDPLLRWTTDSYPAHLDLLYFKPTGSGLNLDLSGGSSGAHITHGIHRIRLDPNTQYINCSVAFMSQCMSLNKCRVSCQSMGAARYRWFHDFGCCECIGHTCLDYGKGEPQCLKCPLADGEEDDPLADPGEAAAEMIDIPDPLEEVLQEEVVQAQLEIDAARKEVKSSRQRVNAKNVPSKSQNAN